MNTMSKKPIYTDSLEGWLKHHHNVPGHFWLDVNEKDTVLCIPLPHMHDVEEFETVQKAKYAVIPHGIVMIQLEEHRKKPAVEIPQMMRVLTELEAYMLAKDHQVYYSPIIATRS